MTTRNPFENHQISIPHKYSEQVKKFCKQANSREQGEYVPFNRQVDFWYFAFLYAVRENLTPEHILDKDTHNITPASILSDYHIHQIQMAYLAKYQNIEGLVDNNKIFNYASDMAYAGMPHVIQILSDEDDKPLDNLFFYIENALR